MTKCKLSRRELGRQRMNIVYSFSIFLLWHDSQPCYHPFLSCDLPYHSILWHSLPSSLMYRQRKDSWECKSLCSSLEWNPTYSSLCIFVHSTISCRELSKPLNRICLTPFNGPHRTSDGCITTQLFLLQKSIHFAFNFYKQHATITRAFEAVPTL